MQTEVNPASRATSSGRISTGNSPLVNHRKGGVTGDHSPKPTRKGSERHPGSIDRSAINKKKIRKKASISSSSPGGEPSPMRSQSLPNSPAPLPALSPS